MQDISYGYRSYQRKTRDGMRGGRLLGWPPVACVGGWIDDTTIKISPELGKYWPRAGLTVVYRQTTHKIMGKYLANKRQTGKK